MTNRPPKPPILLAVAVVAAVVWPAVARAEDQPRPPGLPRLASRLSAPEPDIQAQLPASVVPAAPEPASPAVDGPLAQGFRLPCDPWRAHPWSVGWVGSYVVGGVLIDDWVKVDDAASIGFRLGWDYNAHWGVEGHFSEADMRIEDSEQAIAMRRAADDAAGYSASDPRRLRFEHRREAEVFQGDFNVLYYPRGEAAWRPFVLVGIGVTSVDFEDRMGEVYGHTNLSLPFGLGFKWLCSERAALRVDCINNLALGGDRVNTIDYVTLNASLEFRFGGRRRTYWPWNPGKCVF